MSSTPAQGGYAATKKKTEGFKEGLVIQKRPIFGRGLPEAASGKPLGILYVSSSAPFMSLVSRTTKLLDKGPDGAKWSATKVLPLKDRIDAARSSVFRSRSGKLSASQIARTVRQREVLLIATGRAIEKLIFVANWFRKNENYVVALRTRWSATIDDLFFLHEGIEGTEGTEDAEGAEGADGTCPEDSARKYAPGARHSTRMRNVSCLELAVRLK